MTHIYVRLKVRVEYMGHASFIYETWLAVCCSVLQCVAASIWPSIRRYPEYQLTLQHPVTHCNTLHHTAAHHHFGAT